VVKFGHRHLCGAVSRRVKLISFGPLIVVTVMMSVVAEPIEMEDLTLRIGELSCLEMAISAMDCF
jgi:hypothetical protein